MAQEDREYRVLDRDLGRVTSAEHAASQSIRPVHRLGLAVVFVAVIAEIAAFGIAGQPVIGIMAASVGVAIYLALSIGANDVANALGPAIGAGALRLTTGLFLVAAMEVLGAVIAGAAVTQTLTGGVISRPLMGDASNATMMLAALAGAASWITFATWLGAPVSATHSIVGAIAGAGMASFGVAAVNWIALAEIALGWVASPLISGSLAALILALLHERVLERSDPIGSGRLWLTALVAATTAVLVLMGGIAYGGIRWSHLLLLGLGGAAAGAVYGQIMLTRMIRRHAGKARTMKYLLAPPLVVAALTMGFAHGANDTSNVAAPLTIILGSLPQSGGALLTPQTVLLLSGLGIAAGIVLFGGRLVTMVGSKITRLNAARALCVSLATALTVLGFTLFGLPVSTTHLAVGGVFGVGFYREWRDRRQARRRAPMPREEVRRRHLVRRSHVRTILGAWLITVPLNAAIAAALVAMMQIG